MYFISPLIPCFGEKENRTIGWMYDIKMTAEEKWKQARKLGSLWQVKFTPRLYGDRIQSEACQVTALTVTSVLSIQLLVADPVDLLQKGEF